MCIPSIWTKVTGRRTSFEKACIGSSDTERCAEAAAYPCGVLYAGMALATVFSEMYTHTLDRFNRLPQKYYTEFLNQLGVSVPDVVSASGYVRFDIHPAAEHAVVVPEHTLLGAAGENKGENILFETDARIEATPARLADIFYIDTKADLLQKLDLTRPGQTLFGPVEGENLSQHTLLLSQNEVLAVEGACFIQVEVHQRRSFRMKCW